MDEFSSVFEGVTDPRRSNATRHSLHEMLMIALLSTLCGGEGCADMERFGWAKEGFLRRFMVLKHGIPSHDAFSDLFNALDPGGLQTMLLRLLEDWAAVLDGDVIAIDGKSLRRSFADAATRSPVHLVQAFAETVRGRADDRYLGSTVRRQLAQADLILLNKCDLAGDADEVETWLGETAPDARLLRTVRSDAPIDIVLGAWTGRAALPAAGGPFDHTQGYTTAALDPPAGAEPEALARILADPAHGLLRAKGFMRRPGGGMAAIQTVGSRWTVTDAPAKAPAGLVCIGLEARTDFARLRRAVSDS